MDERFEGSHESHSLHVVMSSGEDIDQIGVALFSRDEGGSPLHFLSVGV